MRARLFWTNFFVLTIVVCGATFFHGLLLHKERLRLIDSKVRDTATALLDSKLNSVRPVDIDQVEEILSEELGETKIGKFFIIRNARDKVIFKSSSAEILPMKDISRTPQWLTIREKGKFIRVLNLQLPRIPDRMLQVGIVLDESLVSPDYFSFTTLGFIGSIFILGLFTAWLLTSTVLKPISRLVNFITGIAKDPNPTLPPVPSDLGGGNKRDELKQLIDSFSGLMDKVNRGHKLSRVWSYQMAHEIKTPLAIMEGEIARAKKSKELKSEVAETLRGELLSASDTVTAFLAWAELEGASVQKNLYAVSADRTLHDIERRLEGKYPGRLSINVEKDFFVLSNIQHLEHLLLNLILNALSYSPANKAVKAYVYGSSISILDCGDGFPSRVIERIGEPFNKGNSGASGKGHGLGLAYVHSVCKLYGWKLDIHSSSGRTEVRIEFPKSDGTSKVDSWESSSTNLESRRRRNVFSELP